MHEQYAKTIGHPIANSALVTALAAHIVRAEQREMGQEPRPGRRRRTKGGPVVSRCCLFPCHTGLRAPPGANGEQMESPSGRRHFSSCSAEAAVLAVHRQAMATNSPLKLGPLGIRLQGVEMSTHSLERMGDGATAAQRRRVWISVDAAPSSLTTIAS